MSAYLRLPALPRFLAFAGLAILLGLFSVHVSYGATIVVDGSDCTLAQAITAANTPTSCGTSQYAGSTGADTISFDANTPTPLHRARK